MSRSYGLALVSALWLALTTPSALAGQALTVDEAVLAALSASPELAQAGALLTQAQGQLAEDRGLVANPRLSASASIVDPLTTVELVQPLSLSGVGRIARAADRADLQAAQARQVRARLVLASDVRLAWAQAVINARQAELAAQALDVAADMKLAVQRRRDAGEATELDLRLVVLAQAGAANAFMASRRDQDRAMLSLVAWTGVDDPILPADPTTAVPTAESSTGLGAQLRSDLVALSAQAQAARARLAQARAAAVPSVALGVHVEDDGSSVAAGPTLSFDLPLWSRNQGAVASQQAAQAVVLSQQIQANHIASVQQRLATGRVGDADRVQALCAPPQLLDDAAAALGQITAGYEGGELDLATALLFRQQVVQGESAVLALTGQVISARLDLLLATEDPALIPTPTTRSNP